MSYRNYTDEDIIRVSKEATSMSQLLKKLGLRCAGGNYANMKLNLQRLGIDATHWTGQAWNKGNRQKAWREYKKAYHLKPHLIKERGCKCECCENTEWLGRPIMLEVHHKDGNRTNNNLDNLVLICPNCHALTKNYRGKNIAKRKQKVFKINWPDKETLVAMVEQNGYSKTGRILGISDNAIRKHLRNN